MLAASAQHKTRPIPASTPRPRLLLVSDSVERLNDLQYGIKREDFEVNHASSFKELRRACSERHDLVVVIASPSKIPAMLKLIRTCAEYADTPVLVESTNINNDSSLAGVLPQYRAMPCNHDELLILLRQKSETARTDMDRRGML
jgi:DNA-binding NtrC family response regulator